jgi:AmmeMemoRadiSam system protein A
VGYGAMAYEDRYDLSPVERGELLGLARRAVEAQVRDKRDVDVPADLMARYPRLSAVRGAFVTLKEHGDLRGCIGTLYAKRPLAQDVVENAVNAAVHDTRFSPVTPGELKEIELTISVLESPRPVDPTSSDAVVSMLRSRKPGLILDFHGRRSTFLPEVWDEIPEAAQFLGHLCQKQGSASDCWRDPATKFETYGVLHLGPTS